MPQVALSTFTNLDIYPGAVVENLGTLLTFNFELDEPARVGGLKIYVDSDTPGILGRLDLSALNDNPDFLSNLTVNQESFENFTGSGFVVTVEAGAKSASLTLPALDIADLNGLDLTTFTLTTREETDRTTQTDPVTGDQGSDLNTVEADGFPIGDYTVDPESASSRVLFADNVADLPPLPVVSFSTTPQVVNEAEGTFLVMDFSFEGEIPDGGVTVNLEGDAARIMEQFDVVQAGIDQETGNIFYRFDEDFVNSDNIVGGILDPFSLEDGDPAENNSDPEAAGDAFLSSFSFTITENTASIRLPVLDDFVQEDDATFTYSPALESAVESGYLVDPDVNSGTFTLTEGVEPATSPTIGVTVGSTTLIRDEQTVMELTFTSEGDIPAEGVVVLLEGPPKGFAEFDFSEPINITGGTIVGTDDIASTLSLLITDPTATVELPVLLEEEGQETIVLPFTLIDGEQYEIDPEASAIEVTIQDPPVISLGLLGGTFNGNDLIVPHLVEQADGIPILSVVLESDGTIPEGGLIVDVNTDPADITQLVNEPQFNPIAFGGQVISAIYDEAGIATGLRVRMDDPNTVVNFQNGVGFDATGPQTVSFFVEEGDRYISTGEAASITVYDTLEQVPPPPEPLPEVGVTIAGGGISQQVPPLVEGEGDITLELTVEGEIPTDGVITYLKTDQEAGLGEFDLLNAEVVGGLFPSPDGDGEGFYFKVTEPTATITVQAAVDDIEEGIETIDFSLQSVPGYTIDDDAQGISLELADDENSKIQVSIDSSPIDLVAEEETLATITLNLSSPPPAIKPIPSRDGTPPEAGILITVQTDGLQEFNLDSLTATGGNIVNVNTDTGTIDIRALEQTVTITATVANDGEAEGLETVLFTLVEPGEDADYQISTTNPEQNQVSFDIYNTLNESPVRVESAESDDTIAISIPIAINVDDDGRPTVSIEVDETELIEGDDVTFSFDALGGVDLLPSPNEPVTILVNGDTLGGLAEFELFDENNNPLFTTVGIESVSILDDETNFSAVLIDPDASITFSVVDDGLNEAEEQFTYTLADEQPDYFVDPNAESVTITIEGVDGIFFGTPGRDIFDAGLTPPGFDGVNNTVFAREGDDLIDTVGGSGGNTLYGEQDNDTFILRSNDTAFGGEGEDSFFLLRGDNIITGGPGADELWLVASDIPESVNIINDFNDIDGDVLGIASLDFDQLTISDANGDTLIAAGGNPFARLIGVDANSLSEDNFIIV